MAAVQGKEAGSGLKLYVDLLSPPCRAIVIFCRVNGINAEEVIIRIPKGDTKTPDHAILRYLATTHDVADHWYPKDAERRALIDNVLDWHHLNIRKNTVSLIVQRKLAKLPNLPPGLLPAPDEKAVAESEKLLKNILEQLETVLLQGPGKFLVNGEQVSIADLSLVCVLKQLMLLDKKYVTDLFGPRKKITAWMDAEEEATNPHFSTVASRVLSFNQ